MNWYELPETEIDAPAIHYYSRIWRSDNGWYQINLSKNDEKYHLIDCIMPWWIPASGIRKTCDTLEEAQNAAAEFGKPNWDDVGEEE